jgi:hypothetical protein
MIGMKVVQTALCVQAGHGGGAQADGFPHRENKSVPVFKVLVPVFVPYYAYVEGNPVNAIDPTGDLASNLPLLTGNLNLFRNPKD